MSTFATVRFSTFYHTIPWCIAKIHESTDLNLRQSSVTVWDCSMWMQFQDFANWKEKPILRRRRYELTWLCWDEAFTFLVSSSIIPWSSQFQLIHQVKWRLKKYVRRRRYLCNKALFFDLRYRALFLNFRSMNCLEHCQQQVQIFYSTSNAIVAHSFPRSVTGWTKH